MGWPGSGVAFSFEGNYATIAVTDGGAGLMDLVVNGEHSVIKLEPGKNTVQVGDGTFGTYHARLTRRSEFYDTGYFGISSPTPISFGGDEGKGFLSTKYSERKILFLGDSITAGFGVGGFTKSCGNTPALHAPLESYAMLAADGLNAEPQLIAISGRGVVHNWDANPAPVMPAQLDFALPDSPDTSWDHAQFMPDVIVTLLGTNDWSVIDPGRDKFRAGYRDMLSGLRERFPNAHIVTVSGPLLDGEQGAAIRDGIDWAMSDLSDENISTLDLKLADFGYVWSCNSHPGQTSMKVMANDLMRHIKTVTEWDFEPIETQVLINPPDILPVDGKMHFNTRVAEIADFPQQDGGTLLIGDSITEAWRDTPFRQSLLPQDLSNHGVSWDTSSGVIRRLPQILTNEPDRVFLKIGTNDISLGRTVEQIAQDVSAVVQAIRDRHPKTDIYLQSVLPREADKLERVAAVNQKYAQIAAATGAIYIDLTDRFAAQDGTLRPDLTYDGLHLTNEGYAVWAEALKPYFNR